MHKPPGNRPVPSCRNKPSRGAEFLHGCPPACCRIPSASCLMSDADPYPPAPCLLACLTALRRAGCFVRVSSARRVVICKITQLPIRHRSRLTFFRSNPYIGYGKVHKALPSCQFRHSVGLRLQTANSQPVGSAAPPPKGLRTLSDAVISVPLLSDPTPALLPRGRDASCGKQQRNTYSRTAD